MYKYQITKSVHTLKNHSRRLVRNLPTGATQRPSKKYSGEIYLYFQGLFLSVMAGVHPTFPKFMWDNLLVQTQLTLNLLHEVTLNPSILEWEYFNGAFDYTATSLGPIGCKIIIHTTSNKRKSWDQSGREGFSLGPALHHSRCIQHFGMGIFQRCI